ncbi:CHAP domain-containing protein [Nonomuraea sp. MG754425]|uniref:CHAP domain-containing protein n=1 Tax=Nonomuraea sp. MG754425 TaxID=2570319 RepID=UPI001F44255A|nr:CHAP domain-containing protein [Nonomuraea sp. MG754425]MCF6467414.1 CHAP domain-containing protein [Nonomuraea sp. MG754425]
MALATGALMMAKTSAKPADRLLAVVRSQLGETESPTGWTKYGSWWARRHDKPAAWAVAAWCDMFLAWCAAQAGLIAVVGDHAYTPSHAQWFKNRGQWGQTPRKGAIVFFDWGGSKAIPAIDHVGIVEAVKNSGRTIVTIEGNTSNRVMRRERTLAEVAGFGYPAYLPTPATKPPAALVPTWTEKIVKDLPTLRLGAGKSKTDPLRWHVKTVFYLLHARSFGVNGGVDDTVFGEPMHDAVRALQQAAGLKDDGVVGPKTWPALMRVS